MGAHYLVSSIGLSEKDVGALKRLLLLSTVRDHVYNHVDDFRSGVDIVLVNADDPDSLQLAQSNPGKPAGGDGGTPILAFASADPDAAPPDLPILVQLPIRGSQVIHTLDRLVERSIDRPRPRGVIFSRVRFERKRQQNLDSRRAAKRPEDFRVLLLLDDADERERLQTLLLARGMTPVNAADDEQALELVASQRIRLVYAVRSADGIDGEALCRRLKQSPLTRAIPFVLLTHPRDLDRAGPLPNVGSDAELMRPVSSMAFNRSLIEFARDADDSSAQPIA